MERRGRCEGGVMGRRGDGRRSNEAEGAMGRRGDWEEEIIVRKE